MSHKLSIRFLGLLSGALLAACGPADEVQVLPLPPLERPSPEARLGLPEISGIWRFAGWEIVRGDSTSLERTFPSFGELRIETQRLDSIAGVFVLGGGPARVVGEVRRDGGVSLATMAGSAPVSYVAGSVESDTLWLELTSILPADEWPRDARAGFIRGPVAEPIAWLRGARPGDLATPPPVDSTVAPYPGQLPGSQLPAGVQATPSGQPGMATPQPGGVGPGPAGPPSPGPAVQPPAQQPPAQQPPAQQPPAQQPPAPQPPAQQPPAQQPPAQQPPAQQPPAQQPEPEPEPEPAPEPDPEPEPEPDLPDLLGEPVG